MKRKFFALLVIRKKKPKSQNCKEKGIPETKPKIMNQVNQIVKEISDGEENSSCIDEGQRNLVTKPDKDVIL